MLNKSNGNQDQALALTNTLIDQLILIRRIAGAGIAKVRQQADEGVTKISSRAGDIVGSGLHK